MLISAKVDPANRDRVISKGQKGVVVGRSHYYDLSNGLGVDAFQYFSPLRNSLKFPGPPSPVTINLFQNDPAIHGFRPIDQSIH